MSYHRNPCGTGRHRFVRFRIYLCALLTVFSWPAIALADDVAAPTQKVGNHSTIATTTGPIRDDELVEFICDLIFVNGGKVKDVKLMVNSCYGGGLLDDMERAFSSAVGCEDIPWVGATASGPEETARGWSDKLVNKFPDEKLGSSWTDGLAGLSTLNKNSANGVIRNGSSGNNVLQDLQATGQNDATGPNGLKLETPHVASGNGGDKIQWNMEGAKHEAVVFGGLQTNPRHNNNIANMKTALENTWGSAPHTIQAIDGGSKQDLFDALQAAIERLDENTQLVLYIDDHGGSSFDMDEAFGTIANHLFQDPESFTVEVPDGWFEGLFGNYFSPTPEMPTPSLDLHLTECDGCSNWNFMLNGWSLPFPGGDTTGLVQLPIPFTWLAPGSNLLEIVPQDAPSSTQASGGKPQTHLGSMRVSRMEVSTGPINELEADQILLPAQSAAFFDPDRAGEGIFVELLDNGRAVVYMFSYPRTGSGQAWMIGVGEQVGEGIIIHELLRPTGATFGAGFDPDDVVLEDFGSLAFHLPTCRTSEEKGSLFIYPEGITNYAMLESHNYRQLSVLVDCETGAGSVNKTLSGSWFDPSHEGEGIILQVLEDGRALVQWFTYDGSGNQMWIQGIGSFDGTTLTVEDLFTTSGTNWGPAFDAADVTSADWGRLVLTFTGCGEVRLDYESSAGFGSGTLNMVRLSNLMGLTCVP
ncbi:hypothetical protein [Elongatibacter sediminis]|uniref:Jacalin-type lectin domain-containing protein n=1 Tax=Elongatibacter sediminis TaxID=3119006 RepID=A0AAW9RMA8_9GAMM